MKTFSGMTDQEVLQELKVIKEKIENLEDRGGFMSGMRLQWVLAKYQNMAEECMKRGISPD